MAGVAQKKEDFGRAVCQESTTPLQRYEESVTCAHPLRDINSLIESRVIPILVKNYQAAKPAKRTGLSLIDSAAIEQLAVALRQGNAACASDLIRAALSKGVCIDDVFLNLFVSAARKLGDWWVEDACDFTEVAIGSWCLQRVMRQFSSEFWSEEQPNGHAGSIFLSAVPGETHTLGVSMLAEFFWRAGYQVVGGPAESASGIMGTLRAQAIDVLGLSASCDQSLRALPRLIASVRRISANRSIRILIGGVATMSCSDSLKITGADALAADPLQALDIAERWCKSGAARKVNTLPTLRSDAIGIRRTAEQQVVG